MIDDFCWSQSIDLFLKNMAKAVFRVRELFLHSLTLIQALDDSCDVYAGFHIEVDKSLVRVIETAGVLSFKHIHHLLDHCLRGEDLAGLLRRDIIEDVLDYRFYQVNRDLTLEIKDKNGEIRTVRIVKSEYEEIGLEFETYLMDEQKSRRNKRIFCFIDQ